MAVKNRVWVLLLVLALLLSLAAASLLLQPNAPDSEELLALLENTLAADSYCYEMYATVETAGGTRSYFDLSGAVSGDNAQLSGTVLGTQTALMFCDGMLYQQIGDIWYAHSMGDIQDAAALFAELLPHEAFRHSDVTSCEFVPAEGDTPAQAIINATPQGWVADYFRDPVYTMVVDKRGKQLEELRLCAVSREDENSQLDICVRFSNVGAAVQITPPEGAHAQ